MTAASDIDHIAIAVPDIDRAVMLFTSVLGFREGRWGTHKLSGKRIVFLHLANSHAKVELIEAEVDVPHFDHLALNTPDVDGLSTALSQQPDVKLERAPLHNDAAKMYTAHVTFAGLKLQLCHYDGDAAEVTFVDASADNR